MIALFPAFALLAHFIVASEQGTAALLAAVSCWGVSCVGAGSAVVKMVDI
ncbi:GlpM family protein [Erwinia pyrifoliae]